MHVKHWATVLATTFVLAGCGGLGIGNPFAGTFNNEPWSQLSPSDSGTISLNISAVGTVGGTFIDSGAGQNFTINGLIDNNGSFSATITPTGSGTASTISGTLSFSGSQLVGTLVDSGSATLNTIVVN